MLLQRLTSRPTMYARFNANTSVNSLRKAYKHRIYPTRKQADLLHRELAAAQRLYNAALQQRRIAWKRRRAIARLPRSGRRPQGPARKRTGNTRQLQCLPGRPQAPRQGIQGLLPQAQGRTEARIPALQVTPALRLAYLPQLRRRLSHPRGRKPYLQGVGEIRVKWHRQIKGKIKTVTVRRRAGRWQASSQGLYPDLYGRLRGRKDRFRCNGQADCSFVSGL